MQTADIYLKTLYRLAQKERRFQLLGSIFRMSTILVLLWLSAILVDNLFHLSSLNRWGFFIIDLIVVGYLLLHFLFMPLGRLLSLKPSSDLSNFTIGLGKGLAGQEDRLINAYQLIKGKGSVTSLKNAAINQLLADVDWSALHEDIQLKNYFPKAAFWMPVYTAFIFLSIIKFDALLNSSYRLLDPANDYLRVPVYRFTAYPGNGKAFSGFPVEIKVAYKGPAAKKIDLLITDTDSSRARLTMEKQDSLYVVRIKSVRKSFWYRASVSPLDKPELDGKIISGRYKINLQTLPEVKALDVVLVPPVYSGLKQEKLPPNTGDMDVLKGSQIQIEVASNKALKKAWIGFSDSSTVTLSMRGKQAMGSFDVLHARSYKIYLQDIDSLQNRARITYRISVFDDAPPLVEISQPGSDIEVRPEARVPMQIDVVDDYGLSSAVLMYRFLKNMPAVDSTWQRYRLPSFAPSEKNASIQTVLDLSGFTIAFGDEMEYYALVTDNNAVDGHQSGRSAVYKFIFPTLDELFNDFSKKEDASVDEMEKVARGAAEIKKEIEKIHRDLKRTEKMDWEKKKELREVLKKHQALQDKVDKIRKDMQKIVEKLDQNDVMSEEILQKYNKLQDLFNDLATPELLKSMQKLRNAIEKENVKQAEKALEDFKMNQESFLQEIERTMELFKQVQLEQQMERLVKQIEEMNQNQKRLSERIDRPAQEKQSIKDALQQQREKQASLEKNLQETIKNKKLQDFDKAGEKLTQVMRQAGKDQLGKQLRQLEKNIQTGQKNKASGQSRRLQKKMARMQQQLSQALNDVRNANKQDVRRKMALTARQLLQLSREQEKLRRQTKSASSVNEDLQNIGRRQDEIRQNLQKTINNLVDLSRKTFFLKPALNTHLNNAFREMQKSLNNISDRRTALAAGAQQRAMGALNRGAQSLQKSMKSMKGSQSGTGFDEFLKQLEQMAGQQGGVNSGTMQLFGQQGKEGGKGPGKRGMSGQRLAARQKAIQQALQQMAEQQAGRRDMLGRLGKMGQDMDEIIKDLLNNNVTRKTIDRQQQILTRMLDAQKSAQTRKLSKKRRAIKPGSYVVKDPKALGIYQEEHLKKLIDAMRRARQQGFSGDYQKLIEAYFKTLTEKQKANIKRP